MALATLAQSSTLRSALRQSRCIRVHLLDDMRVAQSTNYLRGRRFLSNTNPSSAALAQSSASQETVPPKVPPLQASTKPRDPPARLAQLVNAPTQQALDDADVYAEVLPVGEATVLLTDRAAEKLRSISTRENDPKVALRIGVDSGGCHGYQYRIELTSDYEADDYHFSHPTIKPANVIVDAVSMQLVKGSTLDFATELIGSTFRISHNPQAKGGCGCGVSWELKT